MNKAEFGVAIVRANASSAELAKELGLSRQAFYNKKNGKSEFKSSEIVKLSNILNLDARAVNSIFFDDFLN